MRTINDPHKQSEEASLAQVLRKIGGKTVRTIFWLLETMDGCKQLIPALSERPDNYVWTALTPQLKVGIQEMTIADVPIIKRRRYEFMGKILRDVYHYRECEDPK